MKPRLNKQSKLPRLSIAGGGGIQKKHVDVKMSRAAKLRIEAATKKDNNATLENNENRIRKSIVPPSSSRRLTLINGCGSIYAPSTQLGQQGDNYRRKSIYQRRENAVGLGEATQNLVRAAVLHMNNGEISDIIQCAKMRTPGSRRQSLYIRQSRPNIFQTGAITPGRKIQGNMPILNAGPLAQSTPIPFLVNSNQNAGPSVVQKAPVDLFQMNRNYRGDQLNNGQGIARSIIKGSQQPSPLKNNGRRTLDFVEELSNLSKDALASRLEVLSKEMKAINMLLGRNHESIPPVTKTPSVERPIMTTLATKMETIVETKERESSSSVQSNEITHGNENAEPGLSELVQPQKDVSPMEAKGFGMKLRPRKK